MFLSHCLTIALFLACVKTTHTQILIRVRKERRVWWRSGSMGEENGAFVLLNLRGWHPGSPFESVFPPMQFRAHRSLGAASRAGYGEEGVPGGGCERPLPGRRLHGKRTKSGLCASHIWFKRARIAFMRPCNTPRELVALYQFWIHETKYPCVLFGLFCSWSSKFKVLVSLFVPLRGRRKL